MLYIVLVALQIRFCSCLPEVLTINIKSFLRTNHIPNFRIYLSNSVSAFAAIREAHRQQMPVIAG